MKLSLVILTAGKMEGKVIPITLSQFLIGRDPQCHLRPASAVISKRHCAILTRGEQVFLRDFGSTNGTFLNDQPVTGEVALNEGDKVTAGPISFAIKIEAAAEVAATPVDKKTPLPPSAEVQSEPIAKSAPAKPAPKAAPVGSGDDAEDAAMLLLLDGDSTDSSGEGVVPEGSTVFDMQSPFAQQNPDGTKKEEKKDEKKPANTGNTSNAAKAILEKYMKRPRGS